MLNSPNKTPRKNKKISSLHEAINAPEYIPLNYFNERSYEEQEMEYYQSYQNSMWSHGFGTEHKHNKNKVNFPDVLNRSRDNTAEVVFESFLTDKEDELLDANSAVGSESNSIVESLFTQSSKGSGIRVEISSEERRLEQRQKQIDYGKNTIGYMRYIQEVPREKRQGQDPETPDRYSKCSKRAWDGLVRGWRRKLHQYDPPSETEGDDNDNK